MEEWIALNRIDFVTCKTSPQLNIEDAEEISTYDIVILADASIDDIGGVQFSGVEIEETAAFTTHTVSPSHLLKLSRELFAGNPLVYLLQIQGYEWDFSEELTQQGEKNLQKAVILLKQKLTEFQR
jgi:Ni,Fe-hydrogenase maturation factor